MDSCSDDVCHSTYESLAQVYRCHMTLAPQVCQTIAQLYEFRTHLQQKWEAGRRGLEQVYQLRLFEEDASRMATWLDQQRQLFLAEHLDIGETAAQVIASIFFILSKNLESGFFMNPFDML
ncbi:unnamed protein product [Protopolystoma xenopodis]|uniref:Uncharacterized protein n=1 Tax=Protopolystoma xenopodis TaxID=117903 RepID=A0A3S5A8J5_9PLAT|nr:unnamed protein product [Protopolystoma xenopodis]